MAKFTPTKQLELNKWAFVRLITKNASKDTYGNVVHIIDYNGEQLEWGQKPGSRGYEVVNQFNNGDLVAVKTFLGK